MPWFTFADRQLTQLTAGRSPRERQVTSSACIRVWHVVVVSITIAGVLSGCQGTSDRSAGGAGSTTATATAHAGSMNQLQQETERLREERDRLKAELSTQGKNAAKSPSSRASGTMPGPLPTAGDSAGLQVGFDKLAAQLGGSEGLAFTSIQDSRHGVIIRECSGRVLTSQERCRGSGFGRRSGPHPVLSSGYGPSVGN